MKASEKRFEGAILNGFFMLFFNLFLTIGSAALFVKAAIMIGDEVNGAGWLMALAALVLLTSCFLWAGL